MTDARQMALRYRIWAYCEPMGWNCSTKDIGEALGVSSHAVARVCYLAGWMERLRSTESWQFGKSGNANGWNIRTTDDALEGR